MSYINTYKEAMDFIYSLANLSHKGPLSKEMAHNVYSKRLTEIFRALGNPQTQLKYIHIGGTAGKGSTATMCAKILEESDVRTGLYRSPHLTEFIERIQVNSFFINPNDLVRLTARLKSVLESHIVQSPYGIPTYPEIAFILAIMYFAEQGCEYAVLEVGMGGQNDMTNIIHTPVFTAITNVGYDHMAYLGETLTEIATAKSGIIKEGTYFYTTELETEALLPMQEACEQSGITCNTFTKTDLTNVAIDKTGTTFVYKGNTYHLPIIGYHQAVNATIAIEMANHLEIDQNILTKALGKTFIPGRFEIIKKRPLVILDIAHNQQKIAATVQTLRDLYPRKKIALVFGLTKGNKHVEISMKKLFGIADRVYLTRHTSGNKASVEPKWLLAQLREHNPSAMYQYFLNPHEAMDMALHDTEVNDIILVTGSNRLIGEIRTRWFDTEYVLSHRQNYISKK
jgi:dihydrofolate synthase/folylpolyglutamate synthase